MRANPKAILRPVVLSLLLTAFCPAAQTPDPLDRRVGNIKCRGVTCEACIAQIARQSGLTVTVDWKSLNQTVPRQTPPNLTLDGCTVRGALRAVLPGSQPYATDPTHVTVAGAAPVVAGTYALAPLIRSAGIRGQADAPDQLLHLVVDCVRPDEWLLNGGAFPARAAADDLLVAQTVAAHADITRFLAALAADLAAPTAAPRDDRGPFSDYALLHRPVGELRLAQAPLEEAVARLRQKVPFGVVIQWDSINSSGLDPLIPIDLDLSALTLAQALDRLCETTGICYDVEGGVVHLAGAEQRIVRAQVHAYDLRPLMNLEADYARRPRPGPKQPDESDAFPTVSKLIQDVIETDTWKDNGGATGVIRPLGTFLVVSHTPRVHRAVAALLADLLNAANPATPPDRQPPPDPLDTPLAEVQLVSTPLDRAFDAISTQARVRIVIDWKSLEAAGVSRTQPVTVTVIDAPLRKALTVLCDIAASTSPLAFQPDETGAIHVTTAEHIHGVTRIYNVRALIDRTAARPRPPRTAAPLNESRQDAIDTITRTIQDTIATDTWRDNGGSLSSLREFAGLLIVTTSPDIHAKIRALLDTFTTQPHPLPPPR